MQGPLASPEQWDDFVKECYDPNRALGEFRQFKPRAPAGVGEFYRFNHAQQTRDFVRRMKQQYLALNQRRMGIWEALECLNTLVDDSDPDTDLSLNPYDLYSKSAARPDAQGLRPFYEELIAEYLPQHLSW
jgi:inositol oxygenase